MQNNNSVSTPRKAFTLIELLIVVAIIAILAAIAVPNFMEAQTRSKTSRAKSDMRSLATALEAYYVDENSYPPCNSYFVSQNSSKDGIGGYASDNYPVLECLSTPVAYITTGLYADAFYAEKRISPAGTSTEVYSALTRSGNKGLLPYHRYLYTSTGAAGRAVGQTMAQGLVYYCPMKATTYVLGSAGPDLTYCNVGGLIANNSGGYYEYTGNMSYRGTTSGSSTYRTANMGSTYNGKSVALKISSCTNLQYDTTNGTRSFGEVYRVGGNVNNNYGLYFYRAAQQAQSK